MVTFNKEFDPQYGKLVDVAPGVRRLTAANSSPFTFTGTNTYVVGDGEVAVIDPGPDDHAHLSLLLEQLGSERVSHIFVTHTHIDHSAGVGWLQQLTGAPTVGEGKHRAARRLGAEEQNPLDASADGEFSPDIFAEDGTAIIGDGWQLVPRFTPGHTENHMALDFIGSECLFSGDHVMGWSTSIVAPPDGSMAAYMASLSKLTTYGDKSFLSGHGPAIINSGELLAELISHRRNREQSVLDALVHGPQTISALVEQIYTGLPVHLKAAAGLSVLAHLEHLEEQNKVIKATNTPDCYAIVRGSAEPD